MEISYESKWPNGCTVTTVIRGEEAEDLVAWPAESKMADRLQLTRPRPLTENERYLQSQCEAASPAVAR
jgi:hypothetical protein